MRLFDVCLVALLLYFFTGTGVNAACSTGQAEDASGSCVCDEGYEIGSESCEKCSDQTFKTAVGDTACLKCDEHAINCVGANAGLCNKGYFRKAGDNVCTSCADRSYKDAVSDAVDCTPCSPYTVGCGPVLPGECDIGYYLGTSNKCEACEAGTFKSNIGNQICESCKGSSNCGGAESGSCDAGNSRPSYGKSCEPCEAGYFKKVRGNAICTKCSGKTLTCGGNSGGNCDIGYGMKGDDNNLQCVKCDNGKYSLLVDDYACLDCTPNNSECGGSELGACDQGYESNDNGLTCTACAEGKFKPVSGNSLCTNCAKDTPNCGKSSPGTMVFKAPEEGIPGGTIAWISLVTASFLGIAVYFWMSNVHKNQVSQVLSHQEEQLSGLYKDNKQTAKP